MQDEGLPGRSREMEMGLAQMEQIKNAVESLNMQKESMMNIIRDYDRSIEVLSLLGDGGTEDVLVPIGGLAYLKANIVDLSKPLVDSGMGVMMEMEAKQALEKVKERREKVQASMDVIDTRVKELMERYEGISNHTQEIYQGQMGSGEGPEKTF